MCEPIYDVCVIAGTDYYTDIELLMADGTPIDLLGATVESQLLETDTSPAKVADVTVTILSALEGKVRLSLTKTQTQDLLPVASGLASKNFVSDVLVNYPNGTSEVFARVNYKVEQVRIR